MSHVKVMYQKKKKKKKKLSFCYFSVKSNFHPNPSPFISPGSQALTPPSFELLYQEKHCNNVSLLELVQVGFCLLS
jgi:hypothetical protein